MIAPTTWPWERLNQSNASAHDVLATLLDPQPGERWLDVGTGGGGLAFALARRGADVVGVDVSQDGLVHAREQAATSGIRAEFAYGDAEELPFADGAFDGVASAFGVIFAGDHERAAAELARVCRPGGKLGLTLMPMSTRAGEMFSALRRFGGGPITHPAAWAERVDDLLGRWFHLDVEHRESPGPAPPSPTWEESLTSFAPLRELVETLDADRTEALRAELRAVEQRFAERRPSYVLVLGRRR